LGLDDCLQRFVRSGFGAPQSAADRGLAGGLIGGACIPLALVAYVHFRLPFSKEFFYWEFLVPAAVGSTPGLLAYYVLSWVVSPEKIELKTYKEHDVSETSFS